MGLDITALRRARYIEPQPDEDYADANYERFHRVYANPHFEERADGLHSGFYTASAVVRFRAGSYSGFNCWREWLCRFALGVEPREVWNDPESYAGRPFVELIHFADNEGIIGPRTSAKLARDFAGARGSGSGGCIGPVTKPATNPANARPVGVCSCLPDIHPVTDWDALGGTRKVTNPRPHGLWHGLWAAAAGILAGVIFCRSGHEPVTPAGQDPSRERPARFALSARAVAVAMSDLRTVHALSAGRLLRHPLCAVYLHPLSHVSSATRGRRVASEPRGAREAGPSSDSCG